MRGRGGGAGSGGIGVAMRCVAEGGRSRCDGGTPGRRGAGDRVPGQRHAVGTVGPLRRILPPATEARTVEGGRLPALIGRRSAPVARPASATIPPEIPSAVIVEIWPVRCGGRSGNPAEVRGAGQRCQRPDGTGGRAGGGGQARAVFHRHLEKGRLDLADVFLRHLVGARLERGAHLLDEFRSGSGTSASSVSSRAGKKFRALLIDHRRGHAGAALRQVRIKLRGTEFHPAAAVHATGLHRRSAAGGR